MIDTSGSNGCIDCNHRAAIFKHLNKDELNRIDDTRYILSFKPGEQIVKQGAPFSYVLSFTSGLAKIIVEGSAKPDMIVKLVKPVEFIAGPGLFVDNRHYFSVVALEKSCVCAIDTYVFKDVLRRNHNFNEAYLSAVNQNYLFVMQKLISTFEKNTKGRVAEALLYLANDIYHAEAFNLTFSINDLASLSGMSKESAFRCIKDFGDDDIIRMSKKRIEILNLKLLTEISKKG
ncbi:MAG TPA: Crp/Fnr family transcriptional regulator [Bacteroides sp.]|nr:Crp/Fnr family transcriptional regulator [Bacteroides sp.]